MVQMMSSWEFDREQLERRYEQVAEILGAELLQRLLRAGKRDSWTVRVRVRNGQYLAEWTHWRAGKAIGQYTATCKLAQKLSECEVACTCPEYQRNPEQRRLVAWCKHGLLSLFLLRPWFAEDAKTVLTLLCTDSKRKNSAAESAAAESHLCVAKADYDPLSEPTPWVEIPADPWAEWAD